MLLYPLVCFPVLIVMGPLFLLWSYLKHGCLNMPAGHVMLAPDMPTKGTSSSLLLASISTAVPSPSPPSPSSSNIAASAQLEDIEATLPKTSEDIEATLSQTHFGHFTTKPAGQPTV